MYRRARKRTDVSLISIKVQSKPLNFTAVSQSYYSRAQNDV